LKKKGGGTSKMIGWGSKWLKRSKVKLRKFNRTFIYVHTFYLCMSFKENM